jgi:glucose dehydrogenase
MTHSRSAFTALLGALISLSASAQPADFVPVTDAMLQNPDPADWLTWRRTPDHWGYSPLDEIGQRNVRELRLVWTRPVYPGVQEGTPLIHDGVMYFPHPNDITQAIDAVTGDLVWEYRRPAPDDVTDYVLFPSINRNLAIYGNYILDNGADNYAYAIDARTGELAWETRILDYRLGGQASGGPIVANGKVISGRSCAPKGGPEACVITAFDALTGAEIWRTHTIPRPGEPGDETWGGIPYEERRHVGSWMPPSFDPELNQVYVGTSVTSPAPKFMLAGNGEQYLYHNSTLALDVDTGEIVWYLQHVVDHWDLDHPFERLPIDASSRIVIETKITPGVDIGDVFESLSQDCTYGLDIKSSVDYARELEERLVP